MTRIIGGEAGGRRLRTPAGDSTRPTADRVREALFSTVEALLGTLAGRRFLDVYAGSGAVGLEARSRGAAQVVLVEHDTGAARLIRSNARALGLDEVSVIVARAERVAAHDPPGGRFDVAFFDPPYDLAASRLAEALAGLVADSWLAPDALVVVERSRRDAAWQWPDGVQPVRARRYGETMLWYGRFAPTHHEEA